MSATVESEDGDEGEGEGQGGGEGGTAVCRVYNTRRLTFRDRRVALVDRNKGEWAHPDHVVVEVIGFNEVHGGRLPLVEARRQQHGLALVQGKSNESLCTRGT